MTRLGSAVVMALLFAAGAAQPQSAPGVTLYAAGSLRGALTEVARSFEAGAGGVPVALVFGASGLLRDRLQSGEAADVFASANMEHPRALEQSGRAGPVLRFARNSLCALARSDLPLTRDTVVARLLDPATKIGTSTPKADPSGDYAFEMFERIESARLAPPGSAAQLKIRALQLTGGPNSPAPPPDRNVYAQLVSGSLSGFGSGPRWACKGAQARRKAQPGWTPGEHLQRRMRPLAGPTLRAGAIRSAILRCRLVVWLGHTASPTPRLALRLAPARARPKARQAPSGQADIFITYRTNAALAKREQPALQSVPVPGEIDVAADYGIATLRGASDRARTFVDFVLGATGQAVLARYGFAPGG